jgi:DNA primase
VESIADGNGARIREVTRRPERRGASRRTIIEEGKKIPTIDFADRLAIAQGSRWRKMGAEWVTNCLLPDHEDRVPSFTVNPEKNVFWCHGCLRGGDVIELARFVWGYEKHEVATASADLLHEFGREIPDRPASWYAKQSRQKPMRDALQETKIKRIQRRLFKIFLPMVEEIEDAGERSAEREYLWDAAEELAVLVWAGRRAS